MSRGHKHVSIDAYAYQSGMRDYNAPYKVFFSLGALLAVIVADRPLISAATAVYMLLLTTIIGGVPLRDYIRLLCVPAVFILLSGLAIAVQPGQAADAVWSVQLPFGWLSVGRTGLLVAAGAGMKAFGAVSALYLMTLSVPMGEILMVLTAAHVPALIIELMHLIYRYIFILSEQNKKQQDAAVARLGYHGFGTSLRTFGASLANLFILSMKKSGAYYDAMESRGYDGGCVFWEEKKAFTLLQAIPALLYAGMVITICLLHV